MSPYVFVPPRHGPHTCKPPRSWPRVSRRRHPVGTVWECDYLAMADQGWCGGRWRLAAWMDGQPQWSSWREDPK